MQGNARDKGLTAQQEACIQKACRQDANGWIHLKVQGTPFECGFQHGYLIASEYREALRCYKYFTYQTTGMEYQFFVNKAIEFEKKYEIPEWQKEEMRGIAAGLTLQIRR